MIIEACGYCDYYEDGKTKINRTGDADITFPIIKYLSKIPPSTSESRFVTVIQVPGLAVLQRKTDKDLGFYEKVMGSSVVHSWPIFAIFGTMTLAAGMVIWVLVRNIKIYLTLYKQIDIHFITSFPFTFLLIAERDKCNNHTYIDVLNPIGSPKMLQVLFTVTL